MTYKVEFAQPAVKSLRNIPKKQRLMILSWIHEHLHGCENPRMVHGGKQLQGTACGWRWRVGAYRILGQIQDEVLTILAVRIGHKQGVYKNLPKRAL
ncbi:type II toxin-antitoxin system RelE/ParE family toxin [Collinsella sp. AGMB00827]|uniref:Type II toxin-antitoxin system RelE/ParE family toxin n=1 Tax=Collinsella ureilytica TaxID=2869515 RepID=A0ABS7MJJ9_9ACTN|nr:type II toxin-antitoxin system RelE/ParE family toxin [Collinsella urealyticum]